MKDDGEYTWSQYQFKLHQKRREEAITKPIYDLATYTSTPNDSVKYPDDTLLKADKTEDIHKTNRIRRNYI